MELRDGNMKEFKDIVSRIACQASIVLSIVTGMVMIIFILPTQMRLELQLLGLLESMAINLKV